jgi:hypothetical protein
MIFPSKIYKCIDCQDVINYNQRVLDGLRNDWKFTELYCSKCYDVISFWTYKSCFNYKSTKEEVNNFNYVIDEYYVRSLEKDSFVHQQIYNDR